MPLLTILSVQSGHSGVVHPRTSPEMSDIALFGFAAIGVWLVRRALRKRFIESRRRNAARDAAGRDGAGHKEAGRGAATRKKD